jgi:glycosyltransferase involved in cell wall biosynthesis
MTAYNREKYIAEAIESVMASTYQNWELIIVDDCSTDHTVKIARSYKAKDNRIRVYVNEKNLGDYPNRNQAASYAKGKYLKYVDADDIIYRHGLEIIVDNMEQFPEAGWGIMSQRQFSHLPYPILLGSDELYRHHYMHKRPLLNKAPLSVVIKKELFDMVGGFEKVRHFGDVELWHRLALNHDAVIMQDGIVWWRGHNDQESSKKFLKVNTFFESMKMIENNINLNECRLSKEEKQLVINSLKNRKRRYFIKLLKQRKFTLLINFFKYN